MGAPSLFRFGRQTANLGKPSLKWGLKEIQTLNEVCGHGRKNKSAEMQAEGLAQWGCFVQSEDSRWGG